MSARHVRPRESIRSRTGGGDGSPSRNLRGRTAPEAGPEDLCYAALLDSIRTGQLQPSQRLVEHDLARWLGVGRATVRTALARLEQEGIVVRERYRGARVRQFSQAEAQEILEVRSALEALAARYAAIRATEADVVQLRSIIDAMRACQESGDLLRYSDMNAKLHKKIQETAKHDRLSRMLQALQAQHVRFQYRTILVQGRPQQSLTEHAAIVEAIANNDASAAEKRMRVHLENVIESLRKAQQVDGALAIAGRRSPQ